MTNVVAQITNPASPINGLDVVNAVNGFYSGAFNHTVWLVGILVGLLGIVVPTAYYMLQNRQLVLKERALADSMKDQLAKLEEGLREDNKKFLVGLEQRLKGEINQTKAAICMVQGKASLTAGHMTDALMCYAWVLKLLAEIQDRKQIQRQIRWVTDTLFTKVKGKDFNEEVVRLLNEVAEAVAKIEAEGMLDLDLENYKKALLAAQNRN